MKHPQRHFWRKTKAAAQTLGLQEGGSAWEPGERLLDGVARKEYHQRGVGCVLSRTRARKKGLEREEGKGPGWETPTGRGRQAGGLGDEKGITENKHKGLSQGRQGPQIPTASLTFIKWKFLCHREQGAHEGTLAPHRVNIQMLHFLHLGDSPPHLRAQERAH